MLPHNSPRALQEWSEEEEDIDELDIDDTEDYDELEDDFE